MRGACDNTLPAEEKMRKLVDGALTNLNFGVPEAVNIVKTTMDWIVNWIVDFFPTLVF